METKEGYSEVHHFKPREITRARRRFASVVRNLPPESQDFITEMNSIFQEPDVYRQFKSDQGKVLGFKSELINMGLDEKKIKIIFNYFNFPNKVEQNGK